jgi:SAM-dependent methyltransferase
MAIHNSKYFPESQLAHDLLDGLVGLSVGDSAHNDWGLDTTSVDYTDSMDTVFKKEEIRLCGEARSVDIVANGDNIPVADKSFDFVISSHVIEHFFDPIKAIKEWVRIARKYVFIICPQPDADPTDRGKLITGLQELVQRHTGETPWPEVDDHRHWTRWTCETFREMCAAYGWHVSHWQDPDDKVGNGFAVMIDVNPKKLIV